MNSESKGCRKQAIIALGLTPIEQKLFLTEAEEVGFIVIFASHVGNVFETIITDKEYEIKSVLLSLESLYEHKILDIHDIISTIRNCCQMVKRPAPCIRAFIRSEIIDSVIVKDSLKSELCSIFYLPSSTHESRIQGYHDYLDGKNFISPEIHELANPKKEKKHREDPNDIKLTTRQGQVLKLIRERGASNKIIARTLKLSESTVKLHVGAVLKKYNLTNRTQLALFTFPKSKNKDDPKEGESTIIIKLQY